MTRICLIGCVKQKQRGPVRAAELYVSPLFRGRRMYVEHSCDRWFILSTLHGQVPPDAVIEPYDETLTTASMTARRQWAQNVLGQLDGSAGAQPGDEVQIHAGAAYRDFGLVEGLNQRGLTVTIPTLGLRQGELLRFYARAVP